MAEKLRLTQITYAQEVKSAENGKTMVVRGLERGVETVEAPLPCLVNNEVIYA